MDEQILPESKVIQAHITYIMCIHYDAIHLHEKGDTIEGHERPLARAGGQNGSGTREMLGLKNGFGFHIRPFIIRPDRQITAQIAIRQGPIRHSIANCETFA